MTLLILGEGAGRPRGQAQSWQVAELGLGIRSHWFPTPHSLLCSLQYKGEVYGVSTILPLPKRPTSSAHHPHRDTSSLPMAGRQSTHPRRAADCGHQRKTKLCGPSQSLQPTGEGFQSAPPIPVLNYSLICSHQIQCHF